MTHARFVADAFGARMTLVHVLASPEGDQPASHANPLDWALSRREADQYLKERQSALAAQGFARERLATEVIQGRPAERIVTLAGQIDADLTVLSTHGEGGVGSSRLGSTTQQVLALAPGSVLVAPPEFTARHVPPKRVVVAIDGSLRSQSVLPEVAQLARVHCLELLLVHVVAEPKATAVLSGEEDLRLARSLACRLQTGADRYLCELRERLFAAVERVETVVLRELDERRALLDVAGRWDADLLVLAAHGATCDAERAFGTFSAYALAHSTLPVLVLQDLLVKERHNFRSHAETKWGPSGIRSSFDSRSLEGGSAGRAS